ncbi:GGDEF domain-containing protein [Rhizobium halophytocola]|uniref:diguanylate cyclase n=1 Tax=Rhizobium halophytocola TaxID=735519 RepID=A0ABS4E5L4_9HYPH|nr:diguanylate cyclase [Rhizobium halophytocola]MBP1853235.1 diguanylate cyclase [Rhizobium halophytocola]
MLKPELLLSIINTIGDFALLAMGYGAILRYVKHALLRDVAIGLIFGIGACLAVLNSIEIIPGVRIDVRAAMVVLAGPFGGVIGAVEAGLITAAMRYWQGGVGASAGVANIFSTAVLGMCLLPWLGRGRGVSFRQQIALGLLCNVPLLFIFTIPIDNNAEVFLRAIGPLSVGSLVAVVLLARILNSALSEYRRRNELVAEATLDPLTGLLNRRGFERSMTVAFDRLRERQESASVLVVDIDHFKRVNDVFGHDAGDTVLVRIADLIRSQIRGDDIIARFGGEEIVLVMPGIGEDRAQAAAERLRRVIAHARLLADHGNGSHQGVTVSIGVVSRAVRDISFDEMFKLADTALYRAKDHGRNRVEVMQAAA